MKLLIISMAGIGDTLFATPLIHELRANFPSAQIDALVMWAGAKDSLEGNPHLNSIFQKNLLKAGKAEGLQFLWQLRKARYDVSINTYPQSRTEYRMVARFIQARERISHAYDNTGLLDRSLVNRTLPQSYKLHSIENNLACLECLGVRPVLSEHAYELYLTQSETAWADEYLAAENLGDRSLLGVHVGSGGTKNLTLRRWPLGHYRELLQRLNRSRPELGVLLFGGPEEEKDNAELLAANCGDWLRSPQTKSLRQAAALLQRCEGFLSVDTALMHVAAAMKVPKQIVIETPTWNTPIEPYRQPFVLVPNPAIAGRNLDYYRYDGRGIKGTNDEVRRFMESVTVDQVFAAIDAAFGEKRPAEPEIRNPKAEGRKKSETRNPN
jgi:heptosyltransferase-2